MTHWTRLPLHVTALRADVEHGAEVPARVAACEALRSGRRLSGIEVGAGAVDWSGLDAAIAWLDDVDHVAPAPQWRAIGDA